MNFSDALNRMKAGEKITRTGWRLADQWVVYQAGYPEGIAINANTARAIGLPEGTVCRFQSYILSHTADGSFAPWMPTGTDVLADDWKVVS